MSIQDGGYSGAIAPGSYEASYYGRGNLSLPGLGDIIFGRADGTEALTIKFYSDAPPRIIIADDISVDQAAKDVLVALEYMLGHKWQEAYQAGLNAGANK